MDPKGVYDQILKRSFPDISRKGTNLYTLSSGTQKYLITEVKENELTPKKKVHHRERKSFIHNT